MAEYITPTAAVTAFALTSAIAAGVAQILSAKRLEHEPKIDFNSVLFAAAISVGATFLAAYLIKPYVEI